MTTITSRHHPFVRRCRLLARERGALGDEVLLDGLHLLEEAVAARVPVLAVAIGPRLQAQADASALVRRLEAGGTDVLDASDAILDSASPVRTPAGIVAIARHPSASLATVFERPHALVVGVVDVQDPGNVGAIVRAAEAAGATGVVVAGSSADPLGWKALRGSMGSVFRLPVACVRDLATVLAGARAAGIRALATVPHGGQDLFHADLRPPVMMLLGGEGGGLGAGTIGAADGRLSIPMEPPVESLNVAVAAGVIVFEARRQRRPAARP